MISKIKYLFLTITIGFWAIGYFPYLHGVAERAKFFPDDYRYGDLYRLSLLPEFKEEIESCKDYLAPKKLHKLHLYIIGDSFVEPSRVDFSRYLAEKVTYLHWEAVGKITLDSTEKNVLLLETVERKYREHFAKKVRNFEVVNIGIKADEYSFHEKNRELSTTKDTILKKILSIIFPKNVEDRLERSTFNYDIALEIKELKTKFNNDILGHQEWKTVISADKKNIYYFEEAQATHPNSSFYIMPKTQLDSLILNTNEAKKYYQSKGFNQVLLSIIPNKVSIMNPEIEVYNHLIEQVQNNQNLKLDYLNTYNLFKKQTQSLYSKSDTHWNYSGQEIWLNELNEKLK